MRRMTPPSSDRTGILILRLWIEADAREGLRARITQTLDSGDEQAMATAAEPEDIYAVVRTWVEAFVDAETHPVTLG
jgi:antitoxin component HigA of HigAB toxin-antitoxin module